MLSKVYWGARISSTFKTGGDVMQWTYRQVELKKQYPLRISRGVSAGSINLFVTVQADSGVGIGEAAPGAGAATAAACEQQIRAFIETQRRGTSVLLMPGGMRVRPG